MSAPLYTDPYNTLIPIVEVYPGRDIPAHAAAPVTAMTFAAISGPVDAQSGAVSIATATAGGPTCGVVAYSVASGMTGLLRGNARIVRVAAGAPITAGQQVQVGPNGTAVPVPSTGAGIAVGYATDTIAQGALGPISLY